ncbi:acyltransferase [Massilia sp. YIM B02763]|nr:acyltransferase [Massilia sp. YIM B02763]
MDTNVRQRFDLLRFVMIFGVVVLHTPQYVAIADVGNDGFSLFKAFFQNAMFRTTVPVLTFISGYLVFHANLDLAPKKLLLKKARSLLLPFLVFNLPMVAIAWLAVSFAGLKLSYDLTSSDPMVWANAVFGLTSAPINYPLNFLRDMMALVLITPLLGLLLRHMPFIGLAFCVAFFLNNLDGPFVLRDTMPIVFYMGGMVACCKWELRAWDEYAWPCLLVFLVLCASIIYFRNANTTLLRLVSPMLVWPASALFVQSRFGQWCVRMNKYSFFLFMAHAPVLVISWQLYQRVGDVVPYPMYWVATPVLTTALMVLLYRAGMKVMPGMLQFALGGRARRPAGLPAQAGQAMPVAAPAVTVANMNPSASTTNN